MPEHLVELSLESWTIRVFMKNSIGELTRNNAPRLPAIYVVHKKRSNYVGQSVDAFWRVRGHVIHAPPQDGGETVALIFNTDVEMERELLIHIEFGLMLIHLGCEYKLVTKQTDVPLGSADTRKSALDFFETIFVHYRLIAIPLFGSHSPKNRRSFEDVLSYLRKIWNDDDDNSEPGLALD